jgi:hypothetical protein
VETDILGKYVARMLGAARPDGLTLAKLEQAGFLGA